MTRLEATHILGIIAKAFERMQGFEDEAEAVRMAIYDMGIVEEMKKQRDAMIDFLKEYDDTDLVKTKYIRQVMGEYGK